MLIYVVCLQRSVLVGGEGDAGGRTVFIVIVDRLVPTVIDIIDSSGCVFLYL